MNALLSLSTTEIDTLPSLAAAFGARAQKRGDAVAVRCGVDEVSYATLDRISESVAKNLQEQGITRGTLVAIYLPRGIGMIAVMLGVRKVGAAYLPLDPTFPAMRVSEIVTDAKPAALITEAELQRGLPKMPALKTMLLADALSTSNSPNEERETRAATEPDDLTYVIYTSGSTGKPKGVMVSQQNVLRLFSQTAHWFDFNERDVWTMFHSFAFDFSVWEIWGALLTGGTLVIVPYETSRSPEDFYALLSRERVTVLSQTPTAFGLLSRAVEARDLPLPLRYIIFGGEALNLRSLHSWVERFGEANPQLINMYGITETTVHVTYRRIMAADIARETESIIGEPIPDLQIHLLSKDLQPVGAGEAGEMYIGGAGVTLGYLGRPDLTAERFLPDPLSVGRLYRSGDLARRRSDGELVYLGRADRQVKINGFRVEPGEIEAALAALPAMQQVCVTAVDAADGARFLTAYFTAAETLDEHALAAQLAEKLPAHMLPTFYAQLPSLPLTVNGKIDRDALPRPEALTHKPLAGEEQAPLPRQIAGLWSSLLQVDDVSETQNFFDAGGTSLQLMALRTALQQQLERTFPMLWMFEHTSPQSLAKKLEESDQVEVALSPARTSTERQRQSFAKARVLRSAS